MPNKKGGKNYKKSKHADDAPILYERLDDQMYGCVIKILGGCNLLVYCNDGRDRICHIRGNMRKKVWMGVGDIVLISIREEKEEPGVIGRGDICARYDPSVISKLKQKDPSINPKLFMKIEPTTAKNADGPVEDVFDYDDNDENNEEESDEDEKFRKDKFPKNRAEQKRMAMMNDSDNDEIDIDAI